jgi:hypothetical protein
MAQPWVRHPTDLRAVLRPLPLELRATFYALWELARREPEHLGYLVDEQGGALTMRRLSAELGIGVATVLRHRDRLLEAHLVWRDISGALFLPLVIRTEQRFAARNKTTTNGADRVPVAADNPAGAALQGSLPFHRRNGTVPLAEPPHTPQRSSERFLDVRPPPDGESLKTYVSESLVPRLDWEARVPETISDGTTRYLVSKLAALSPKWAQVLTSRRNRISLEWLASHHASGLVHALQQASDDPEQVRNPSAWLLRTAPAIEEELVS